MTRHLRTTVGGRPLIRITEEDGVNEHNCLVWQIRVELPEADHLFLIDEPSQYSDQLRNARELAKKEALRLQGVVIDTTLKVQA